ncbi:hypothetical protein [Streptomyces sp. DH37]|uniref:hypothetical protein n=1 Tax=Streptomyces sp. DH37 TaxID=3040122 RepID=UPI002442C117|nr:hypothetical protein [Streptomyces sp. DH37]MDG9703748.1 hypothetical protein [Streptomyces sp. DH37]
MKRSATGGIPSARRRPNLSDGRDTPVIANSIREQRRAALTVADRIAAEHPHPLDDTDPAAAGRALASQADIACELRGLLDCIGLGGTR